MKEVERQSYIKQLDAWRDKQIIKVITGIRRAGKSTLLRQYQQRLLASGVDESRIVNIRFEDMGNDQLLEAKTLYNYLKNRITSQQMYYIFLDEVQLVEGFERVVNSLYLLDNVDIYLTGSNSHMMSGELSTLLSGRYISIHVLPLSFSEFESVHKGYSLDVYNDYTDTTSFPYALHLTDSDLISVYLHDIYNTVVMRDVVLHNKIDNVPLLMRLSRFMADNIGNLTTAKRIADTLTSTGLKTNSHTIENYMRYLTESYLFYPVQRYNIQGGEILRIGQKYYLADVGLRGAITGKRDSDYGRVLENVVYLELLRRGYEVFAGVFNGSEVDFVCRRNGVTEYYQVSESVVQTETLQRELFSLKSIRNSFPKFLLTLDNRPVCYHEGIQQRYVVDWLMER